MAKEKLVWKIKPERRDYVAATSFLSLIFPAPRAKALVRALHSAPVTHRAAKDLLRASGLPLLPMDEASVKGDLSKGIPLVVADGYHRICAVCHYDELAPVASQIC
jgi:hypothetical protein